MIKSLAKAQGSWRLDCLRDMKTRDRSSLAPAPLGLRLRRDSERIMMNKKMREDRIKYWTTQLEEAIRLRNAAFPDSYDRGYQQRWVEYANERLRKFDESS